MKVVCKYLLLIFTLSTLTSCSFIFKVVTGVNGKIAPIDADKVQQHAQKWDIPAEQLFLLDSLSYSRTIKDWYEHQPLDDSLNAVYIKNDLQPVQIRRFNQKGEGQFKVMNCYLSIPIDWNISGSLNQYPPSKLEYEELNHTFYNWSFLSKHLQNEYNNQLPGLEKEVVVVFWNRVFQRPSRKLIKTIQEYQEQHPNQFEVIYVNTQNQLFQYYIASEAGL